MHNIRNKGFIWNSLGSTMYGVNSFIMLALVSRIGTVEEAGAFGIAFTTAQLLYIIGLFGVPHYQMTDYDEKYSFSSYGKVRVFSCALMLLCCGGAVFSMGFTGLKRTYTLMLTILMLLNVIGELFQSLFFQKNRLDLSGSALFYRTFWALVFFCITAFVSDSILLALTVQIAVNALLTGYYGLKVAPEFVSSPISNDNSKDSPGQLLWECLPLAASLLIMNVVINMSKYGIEFFSDDMVQGYYSMIFMPAQVINLCSQFIFKPFLNQYSRLIAEKKTRQFFSLLYRQMIFVAGVTMICCIAAFFVGVDVLGFVYGKDLSPLVYPLTFVILGGGIYACCQLFYYILIILRQQRSILIVYIVTMIFSAVLTLIMVMRWQIMGAVLAFGGTHFFILLGYLIIMRKTILENR